MKIRAICLPGNGSCGLSPISSSRDSCMSGNGRWMKLATANFRHDEAFNLKRYKAGDQGNCVHH